MWGGSRPLGAVRGPVNTPPVRTARPSRTLTRIAVRIGSPRSNQPGAAYAKIQNIWHSHRIEQGNPLSYSRGISGPRSTRPSGNMLLSHAVDTIASPALSRMTFTIARANDATSLRGDGMQP
jgi:hypothetical protein